MPDSLSERLFARLSPDQRARVLEWLPDAVFIRDHSWGLVGTVVLEAVVGEEALIIKAAGESDGHLARELQAHREGDARVLVTQFIPGELVEGNAAERETETYRQAGALLASLHGQLQVVDEGYWRREQRGALGWLDKEHRIDADVETRLRRIVESWPTPVSVLVPTHGDWQPRNWVTHESVVSAIDFGRAALRPAYTDFSRLSAQQFLRDPRLEDAFLEGYGSDPRDPEGWQRQRIREAIGTAVWAHQVGDADFEAQGHCMLAAALDDEGKPA